MCALSEGIVGGVVVHYSERMEQGIFLSGQIRPAVLYSAPDEGDYPSC
jgi:hypothetical protein